MDTYIVLVYCLCDDLLKAAHHRDDPQCRISDAEVMTIALVAAMFFGGNQALSNEMLYEQGYIKVHLSRSRFCRRLQRVRTYYEPLFAQLGAYFKQQNREQVYVIDSMPVPVCDNYRILRCRIYQDEPYRGRQASKKRYFYGLKLHLLVTEQGEPVEFSLSAGSEHDLTGVYELPFDLPPGATVYGDKAYVQQVLEAVSRSLASTTRPSAGQTPSSLTLPGSAIFNPSSASASRRPIVSSNASCPSTFMP